LQNELLANLSSIFLRLLLLYLILSYSKLHSDKLVQGFLGFKLCFISDEMVVLFGHLLLIFFLFYAFTRVQLNHSTHLVFGH